jgi:sterol desaturase/sphingolipid hydroxylase (fatty acid hydroxylase superfamily)
LTIIHKNYKKRKLTINYYKTTFTNVILSFIIFICIFYYKKYLFTDKLFDIKSVICYFIIADTLLYWYHRLSHRTQIFNYFNHTIHHEAIDLLPLDIFYVDRYDLIITVFLLNILPLLLIKINIIEYVIILLIILIHNIYIHSEYKSKFLPLFIDSSSHKNHHHIGKGNYALLTIWDNFMDTIILPKHNKKRKNKRKTQK